jgi:hypothetical protein
MTFADLRNRTLTRLNEDTTTPVYWTAREVGYALNEGQRLYALLTLCLEAIVTFPCSSGSAFYHTLATYSDWLAPLRVQNAAGRKVQPASLDELDALDDTWTTQTIAATHYGCLGWDFLYVRGSGSALTITYARLPVTMVADNDQAEIIDASQPCLIDFAIGRVRAKQGGDEFAKSVPYFKRFLDAAKDGAADSLARSIAGGHDRQPFELTHYPKLLAALTQHPKAVKQ